MKRRTCPIGEVSLAVLLAAVLAWGAVPQPAATQAPPAQPGRVILVSLDGMGSGLWRDEPAAQELVTLRRIASAGVAGQGVIPAFPSLTAPSHAAIWTGAYGNVNGIGANQNLVTPRREHTVLERRTGFRAESLAAEPVWVAAGRQRVRAVSHQATQAFPFLAVNTGPGAPVPPVVINSYQTATIAPDAVVDPAKVTWESVAWSPALPAGPPSPRSFRWRSGAIIFHAALVSVAGRGYDAIDVAINPKGPRVRVLPLPAEDAPPRDRPLARRFSDGLPVVAGGPAVAAVAYFRLFELSPDGSGFVLYQSALKELGVYDGSPDPAKLRAELLKDAGGFVGNGPHAAYETGRFGKRGGGLAERRYLEGVELSIRQFNRYTEWLWKRFYPRLFIDYASFPDEFESAWWGIASVNGALEPYRRWAFAALERRLQCLSALAGPNDSLIFLGDHGMGAVSKEVRVNVALEKAGLLRRTLSGAIDLSATQAVHHSYSVLVNTDEWRSGIVPRARREEVVRKARQALEAVRDPESGAPVFTAFFRPEENGNPYGLGGPSGGDLYFDLAPGYRVSDTLTGPVVARLGGPEGYHGLRPDRADMMGAFFALGPRFPKGGRWPAIRSIDIAPLVADLLGIRSPAQSQGRSPLQRFPR